MTLSSKPVEHGSEVLKANSSISSNTEALFSSDGNYADFCKTIENSIKNGEIYKQDIQLVAEKLQEQTFKFHSQKHHDWRHESGNENYFSLLQSIMQKNDNRLLGLVKALFLEKEQYPRIYLSMINEDIKQSLRDLQLYKDIKLISKDQNKIEEYLLAKQKQLQGPSYSEIRKLHSA